MFTLKQLSDAATIASTDPREQGEALAAIILSLSQSQDSAPTIAPAKPAKRVVTAKKSTAKKPAKKTATIAPARKASTPKTAKQDTGHDWRTRPATKKQLARIAAFEERHGFEPHGRTTLTAGQASDYYASLKAAA